MMKLVIAIVEKSAILSFEFMTIEDNGKIPLEVFRGSAGGDLRK
jgi:hypothetical protein